MSTHTRFLPLWLAVLSSPAVALQLDCQDNGDGTYFCVEIDPLSDAAGSSRALSEAVKSNNPYIEEARKDCVYEPPPRRGSTASGSRAALYREKEKTAREAYERCVAHKAHEIKKNSAQ